jgi:hypothetical protein
MHNNNEVPQVVYPTFACLHLQSTYNKAFRAFGVSRRLIDYLPRFIILSRTAAITQVGS